MKRKYWIILWAVALLMQPVWAGVDEGLAAAEAGNFVKALKELRPFADKGNADAQYYLGVMYDNGNGVQQDRAQAVGWYRKAAELGHVGAQYNLSQAIC